MAEINNRLIFGNCLCYTRETWVSHDKISVGTKGYMFLER